MTPVLLACALSAFGVSEDAINLKPLPSGVTTKVDGYRPIKIDLTAEKPASVTKLPDGLAAPMFGTMPLKAGESAVIVAIDEPEGKESRLLVDSNGNGDLTDDPATEWAGKPRKQGDKTFTLYSGAAVIELGTKDSPFPARVAMYRFDKNDPQRAQLAKSIFAYRDFGLEGDASLGGKTYKALLVDETLTGNYRGAKAPAAGSPEEEDFFSGVLLFVDVNGNGKYDRKNESFDVAKPFNIGGTTYEVADMKADGTSFKIAKSSRTVEPTPDHAIGNKITAFTAKAMDGKSINFPGDYKGKVVLLDFWATWCGPCMREVPSVVAAYEKFHGKGFDILGVSLDKAEPAKEATGDTPAGTDLTVAKMNKVMADKSMTWPQVYDGKFWKAEIAKKYMIDSIPATFLVDGDTGIIIGANLRGEKLAEAVEAALKKKSGG